MDDIPSKVDGPKTARYPQYEELRARQRLTVDTEDEMGDDAVNENAARPASPAPTAQSDETARQSAPPEETTMIVMKAGIPVHIPIPPGILLSHKVGDIKRAFDTAPSKATTSQFAAMLNYAVLSNDSINRFMAWDDLTHMINTRPDMTDTDLLKTAVENSKSDPDSRTRVSVELTLAAFAEKPPDLVDANMVTELRRTAAIPFSTREYKAGDGIPYVGDRNADGTLPESGGVGAGREGYQCDLDDNESKARAQKTLDRLLKQRPDLDFEHHPEQRTVQKADAKTLPVFQTRSSSRRPSIAFPGAP